MFGDFFCFFQPVLPWFFLVFLEDIHLEKKLFGFGRDLEVFKKMLERDWKDFLVDITNRKIFGGSLVLSLLVKMRGRGKLKKRNKRESKARAK